MQRMEVSCAVRHIYIYMSLDAKGLKKKFSKVINFTPNKLIVSLHVVPGPVAK